MKPLLLMLALLLVSCTTPPRKVERKLAQVNSEPHWPTLFLPNGAQCQEAFQCASRFCGRSPYGVGKVCDTPNVYCYGQSEECGQDMDCCSERCGPRGKCLADGVLECLNNGATYMDESQCCSRRGNPRGVCSPSAYQCLTLRERCSRDSDCCSNNCSPRGECTPALNFRQ